MSEAKIINVRPFYGWGWFEEGSDLVLDVPAPFEVQVTQTTEVRSGSKLTVWRGTVISPEHEFNGYSVQMGPRHVGSDVQVNIKLELVSGRSISGYGSIDLASIE